MKFKQTITVFFFLGIIYKATLFFLFSALLLTSCDVTKKRNKEVAATGNAWYLKNYTYSDGNANRYVISKNGFEYFPVSPAESSTSNYSGGSYLKKLPELSLFYALVDNIKIAFETTADHTGTREKGTGLVEIHED
ncbi:MAG: hypothetical protein H7Y01_13600, partial [Ferruginibacter sp.]|nr:hypothetical protein [Chitinophagaceae bacterium]